MNTTIEDVKQYFDQFGKVSVVYRSTSSRTDQNQNEDRFCGFGAETLVTTSQLLKLSEKHFTTRLEVEGGLQREEEGEEGEKLVGEARKGKITRPRGSGSSGRSSGGLEEGGEGRARGEGGREKFCNVCVVIVKKEEGLSESELI